MSSVIPYTAVTGQVITAAALNENLAAVLALATGVPAAHLNGGITRDLLTDKYALENITRTILPNYPANGDWAAPSGYNLPTAAGRVAPLVRPVFRPGWEAFVCGYVLHVEDADIAGSTGWSFDARINGATIIGGQTVSVSGSNDDQLYIVAANDPIANPLHALAEGDYIEFRAWEAGGAAKPSGVSVTLCLKHELTP